MSPLLWHDRQAAAGGTRGFVHFFIIILHRRYWCLSLGRSGLYPCGRALRGAAQEARYPAGTLGDIQAVTAKF